MTDNHNNNRFVLVADDIDNRLLVKRVLEDIGLQVEAVPDGKIEVDCVVNGSPDSVIAQSRKRGVENRQKVFDAVPEREGLTCSTLAKATDLNDKTVKRHLDALIGTGSIEIEGTGRWIRFRRIE